MNINLKFYEISNEDEEKHWENDKKSIKQLWQENESYRYIKWQISRLKDCQWFNRKSQIKKKSSHIKFSSSKSKMNSSLNKSLKVIDVYDQINFEEFHTDSGSLNSEESLKNGSSVLFNAYSDIHEHADGNWLFREMSRGLTGEP